MIKKSGNYKLVMLGDTSVGKSCLAVRFTTNKFCEFQEPTIGAAFLTSIVEMDDITVKFEIWDTAGQERYRSLAPMYYRGAFAAVVVYDITNKDSFVGACNWVNELKRGGRINCIIILAGNKLDLESDRKVDKEEVDEYANNNNIIHIETSAKTNFNVQYIFKEIAKKLLKQKEENKEDTNLVRDTFDNKIINYDRRNSCC